MAAVAVIQKHPSHHPQILHLLHCLYFYSAFNQYAYSVHYLPGVDNVVADALSRNNMSLFYSLPPPQG